LTKCRERFIRYCMPEKPSIPGDHSHSRSRGVALKALSICFLAATVFVSGAPAQHVKKPLSKEDVIGLLQGHVDPADLATACRGDGIKFEMNPATEKELRDAGANDNLINVLRELSPKPKSTGRALSKSDIVNLLQGAVAPDTIVELAQKSGIDFVIDAATEKELRDAGADSHLINFLMGLSPGSKTQIPPSIPSNPPPRDTPPVLLIEATPGGAQVYIDDEPKATTSPEGRVKFGDVSPGMHVVRLSAAGYMDHEEKVVLKPGQTTTVFATLAVMKPPAPTIPTPPVSTQARPANPLANTTPAASAQIPSASSTKVESFLVAHDHGFPAGTYCTGMMLVGNGKIRYQGVRAFTAGKPGGTNHSFDISADEIKEVKRNNVYLAQIGGFHIKLKKGTNINLVVIDAQGRYQPPDGIITAIESLMSGSLK
jgi:PEGA domain